jgi:hypothetical protein
MTDSIYINQMLRPLRLTMLVSGDQATQMERAFELNCSLWGGILNPIVALETDPDTISDVLSASQSDYLVNLSGNPLPQGIRSIASNYILDEKGLHGLLQDHPDGRHSFMRALDVAPLLRWYRSLWYTRLPAGNSSRSANHFLPVAEGSEWESYSILVYGRYPDDFTTDFSRLFQSATLAQHISIPIEKVSSVHPIRDVTPLNFTLYGISAYSSPFWTDFTTHVLYVGDAQDPTDWLAFWNLRAFGMRILFVPVSHIAPFATLIRDHFEAGHYPLSETVYNHTLIQKSPSLSSAIFTEAVDEIRMYNPADYELHVSEDLPEFRLASRPWMGESYGPPSLEAPTVTAAEQFDLVQLIDERIQFRLIEPPFAAFLPPSDPKQWAVSISSHQIPDSDYWVSLPYSSRLEIDLRDQHFTFGDFRLSPRENTLLLGDRPSRIGIATLYPPTTFDVFKSYLKERNLELTDYSEKGRYSMAIEKAMGGIYGGARLLCDPGVRAALAKLSHPESPPNLTRAELLRVIGENRQEMQSSSPGAFLETPETLFDHLLTRNIIRPGLRFKCRECYRQGWYSVGHFGDTFECPYCFTIQPTPSLEGQNWRYRSSGMFSTRDVGYGSLPVICTSLFFHGALQLDVRSLYSFCVKTTHDLEIEVDLAAIRISHRERSELVFCECKSGRFKQADFSRLTNLAQSTPGVVLCVATLLPELSDKEKEACEEIFATTALLITLTKRELETSDIDTTSMPDRLKYPRDLHSLAYATRALNL